jgi:prophage antirepressor-like protein
MENLVIKTFQCADFKLNAFYNKKTDVAMFLVKEIGTEIKHSNIIKALKDAKLDDDEILSVNLSKYKNFKKQLMNHQFIGQKTGNVTFITESGLYNLLLSSKLPEHVKFRKWVTKEVLPSIRKTGHYDISQSFSIDNLEENMNPQIQKQHSKEVNALNMEFGGVDAIIKYNQQNCLLNTGRLPRDIRALGKRAGVPASKCKSAKEVLRHTHPERAEAMSLLDNAVCKGFKIDNDTEEIMYIAQNLFKKLRSKGILPGEAKQLKD